MTNANKALLQGLGLMMATLLIGVMLLGFLQARSALAVENTLPVCSAAVHDAYRVQGPDGQWYASWHPQIDHYSNCRFDHEHGSNPALVGPVTWDYGSSLVPAYGYVSGKANESEGHAGF